MRGRGERREKDGVSEGAPVASRRMNHLLTSLQLVGNNRAGSEELPPLAGDVDILAHQLRHASLRVPERPLRIQVVEVAREVGTCCCRVMQVALDTLVLECVAEVSVSDALPAAVAPGGPERVIRREARAFLHDKLWVEGL